MLRLKQAFGTLDGRFGELAIRLGWMALVVLLIYAIQHAPLNSAWQTAISEGIAIFGGVELILDKLNDIRRSRENDQLRKEAKQAAAEAQSKIDELNRRNDEKDEIIKNLRQRLGDPEA